MPNHRPSMVLPHAIAVAIVLGLSACAPEPPAATGETASDAQRPPTVIDPQLEALDKAKGVESQVLDASRRSIDEADEESR